MHTSLTIAAPADWRIETQLERDDFHGEWNYRIHPTARQSEPVIS